MRALRGLTRLKDDKGAVAVEFGMLAPLLVLFLFVVVEIARLWMVSREFEAAVTGITRHLARYPEYDSNVRAFAPPIAASLMPFGNTNGLNLAVYSLKKDAGGLSPVFSHVLFGSDPGVAWSSVVTGADYVFEECVIVVTASYRYTPLFTIGTNAGFTLTKSYALQPSFNRNYPWNNKAAPDKYVY